MDKRTERFQAWNGFYLFWMQWNVTLFFDTERVRLGLRFSSVVATENGKRHLNPPWLLSQALSISQWGYQTFTWQLYWYQIPNHLNTEFLHRFCYMPFTLFIASHGYETINLAQVELNFQFNKALWPFQFYFIKWHLKKSKTSLICLKGRNQAKYFPILGIVMEKRTNYSTFCKVVKVSSLLVTKVWLVQIYIGRMSTLSFLFPSWY